MSTTTTDSNKQLGSRPLISTHTFGFAFHLETTELSPSVRAAMKDGISGQALEGKWEDSDFSPWSSAASYNEYQYFFKQVINTIYAKNNATEKYGYRYRLFNLEHIEDRTYSIRTGYRTYELEVDEIHLSLLHCKGGRYSGVLSLFMSNRKDDQCLPIDILRINQVGRQLYPSTLSYSGKLLNQKGLDLDYEDDKEGLSGSRLGLPTEAIFCGKTFQRWLFMNKLEPTEETDKPIDISSSICSYFEHPLSQKSYSKPDPLPTYGPTKEDAIAVGDPQIHATIPAVLYTLIRDGAAQILKKTAPSEWFPVISSVADSRMHVHSYYGSSILSEQATLAAKKSPFSFSWSNNFWYRMVFVDEQDATHTYTPEREKILSQQTELRWAGYGTLYGFSRYASVMLSNTYEKLREFNAAYTVFVFRGTYYTMVQLVMLQRAAMQLLSQEVSKYHTACVSGQLKNEDKHKQVIELSRAFTRFRERLYYPQLTPQDQGIDFYNHLQKQFGTVELLQNLESEIGFMTTQSELETNQDQAESTNKLNKILYGITAIALVPTLMPALYSIPVIGLENKIIRPFCFWACFLLAVVFACSAAAIGIQRLKTKKSIQLAGIFGFIPLAFVFMLLPMLCAEEKPVAPTVAPTPLTDDKTKTQTEEKRPATIPLPIEKIGPQD